VGVSDQTVSRLGRHVHRCGPSAGAGDTVEEETVEEGGVRRDPTLARILLKRIQLKRGRAARPDARSILLKRIRLKRGVDTVEEDTVEEGGRYC
jgi:hypothetical protein